MKIYVITRGEYSDYHICSVVTDYEKAQILMRKFSDSYYPANIEEFDTEEFSCVISGKNLYCVSFDKNGNMTNVFEKNIDNFDPEDNPVQVRKGKEVLVYVFAFNKESAVKIAAEKRAMELSNRGYV